MPKTNEAWVSKKRFAVITIRELRNAIEGLADDTELTDQIAVEIIDDSTGNTVSVSIREYHLMDDLIFRAEQKELAKQQPHQDDGIGPEWVAPCPSAECECAECVAYVTGADDAQN